MPDNEEARKSVAGIVTPNVDKDADWRREVAGIYAFGAGGAPTGAFAGSPVNVPIPLLIELGLV